MLSSSVDRATAGEAGVAREPRGSAERHGAERRRVAADDVVEDDGPRVGETLLFSTFFLRRLFGSCHCV